MAVARLNVLERAGKIGTDLILDHLFGYKNAREVADELTSNGHRATERNVRNLLRRYKDEWDNRPLRVGTKLITHREVNIRIQELREEVRKSFSSDPIDVLNKNIYELEKMKDSNLSYRDFGSLLDLQSKLAGQLAKIVPPDKIKIDINKLLHRNDLTVNFIIQMDLQEPGLGLKDKFLEYLKVNGATQD